MIAIAGAMIGAFFLCSGPLLPQEEENPEAGYVSSNNVRLESPHIPGRGNAAGFPDADPLSVSLMLDPYYTSSGQELVSFGLPFPEGVLSSIDNVMVSTLEGEEIPANVEGLVPWRDISGELGSWLSVFIQFEYDFSEVDEAEVLIYYGEGVTRQFSRDRISPEQSIFELPSAQGEALKVWPLMSAEWLTATGVAGDLTPSYQNDGFFERIEEGIEDHFSTYRDADLSDYAHWAYDRTTTLYTLYVRSGHNGLYYLREAFRSARLYQYLVYDEDAGPYLRGAFSLKDPLDDADGIDIKYCFTQAIALHHIFTGDEQSPGKISDIRYQVTLPAHDLRVYYTPGYFWTERHFAFRWLALLHDYIVTGDGDVCAEIINQAQVAFEHQNSPPDELPSDGSWRHAQYDHGEGGCPPPGSPECPAEWIASPWMSSLIVEALLTYHRLSGSLETGDAILDFGTYLRDYGIKRENLEPWEGGIHPWYISSFDPQWCWGDGNESAHNLEAILCLTLAQYFEEGVDHGIDIADLYQAWIDGYGIGHLTNPIRQYAWTFRWALQFLSYIGDFSDPRARGVSFERLEDTGLGVQEWGFGLGVGDYDGDSYPDITMLCHSQISPPIQRAVEVYGNNGDLTFSQVYVSNDYEVNGVSVIDFEGDDILDMMITADFWLPGPYLRGDGSFGFSVPTPPAFGVEFNPRTAITALAWGDFDNDGDLDIISENTGPTGGYLWERTDNRTFDRREDTGVPNVDRAVNPRMYDIDNDGDQDAFIGEFRYGGPLRFHIYLNQLEESGVASFAEATDSLGIDPIHVESTYNGSFADLDNDGDLDLLLLGAAAFVYKNLLQETGDLRYEDCTTGSGLPAGDPRGVGTFADFNNDGFTDFVLDGYQVSLDVYINQGGFKFALLTGYSDNSRWAGIGDFDRDGRVDIIAQDNSKSAPVPDPYVLHNTYDGSNHWMGIRLRSSYPLNRQAVGAKVWIYEAGGMDDPGALITYTQHGLFTSSPSGIHLGVGSNDSCDIKVLFPEGSECRLYGAQADQTIEIADSCAITPTPTPAVTPSPTATPTPAPTSSPAPTPLRVNYQPGDASPPADYQIDDGSPYGTWGPYGWR